MKLIFLDIDGVLNNTQNIKKYRLFLKGDRRLLIDIQPLIFFYFYSSLSSPLSPKIIRLILFYFNLEYKKENTFISSFNLFISQYSSCYDNFIITF